MSSSRRKNRFWVPCFKGVAIGVLAIQGMGCGGSATESAVATEAAEQQQQKVKELAKKGMNFTEIRKTLRGEPIDPRPKSKRKSKGR